MPARAGRDRGGDAVGHTIGLVIDGEVVAGEAGTYPVTNPVRPAEVVLDGPSASTAQLDRAVAAARRAAPPWAALSHDERAELVGKAAAAAAAVVGSSDLARLLDPRARQGPVGGGVRRRHHRRDGRGLRPPGRRRSGGAGPSRAAAGAAPRSSTSPTAWWPPSCPSTGPSPFMGNKVLPALLTGNTVVVKTPPTCPGAMLAVAAATGRGAAARRGQRPSTARVSARPGSRGPPRCRHGLVHRRRRPPVAPVMAGASAALKPVVLELGGNDPAIIAPDVDIDDALAAEDRGRRLHHQRSGVHGRQAALRPPGPGGRPGRGPRGPAGRTRWSVTGWTPRSPWDRCHRRRPGTGSRPCWPRPEADGARVHRPARVRDEDAGAGGYLVSPAVVEGAADDASIVSDEQFAPALPVLGYRHARRGRRPGPTPPPSACAPRSGPADDDRGRRLVARLQAGTVFVNAHGTAAMDHRAPFGGWKQSGYGVELGPEGMAGLHPPAHSPALPGLPVILDHAPGAGLSDPTDAPNLLKETPCSTW